MIDLEIWSDIVCPFCYIGKRHLDIALSRFEYRNEVRVTWKSFELDPSAARDPQQNVYEMLSKKYGQSLEWAKQMTEQVTQKGAAVGLYFDFDRLIRTPSFDAHRLSHLAAKHQLQDLAQERLFAAHFTDGKDIADPKVLERIGAELGLDPREVQHLLAEGDYRSEVRREEQEASSLGVTGVPFFLFNRKYAISGAQPVEVFIGAFQTVLKEQRAESNG